MADKALVGEKAGMTQIWDDQNRVVPVTVLKVSPCRVVQIKRPETDGYSALQVTYGNKKVRSLTKPEAGHFDKAAVEPGVRLVELRIDDTSGYEVGQELGADLLAAGDKIDVTAVSKGKGTAGGMKRHNFKGHPAVHGAHRVHRAPGSIGVRNAGPGVQGHPHGGAHGGEQGHHAQPRDGFRRRRARAGPRQGFGAGAEGRLRPGPQRHQGRS